MQLRPHSVNEHWINNMNTLIRLVCNRFALGAFGVLLLFGGGYWAGLATRPAQSSTAIHQFPVSTTETVSEDTEITVLCPDGTTVTAASKRQTKRTSNSVVGVAQKSKYSIAGHMSFDSFDMKHRVYSVTLGRRLLDTPIWAELGYRHVARPEFSVGMRVEF
jgi:hypothetical protein